MTDIPSLLLDIAPMVLLIAFPILMVRLLDGPDLRELDDARHLRGFVLDDTRSKPVVPAVGAIDDDPARMPRTARSWRPTGPMAAASRRSASRAGLPRANP